MAAMFGRPVSWGISSPSVPDGEGRPGHALHIFKLGTKKDAELPTEVKSPELGPGKPRVPNWDSRTRVFQPLLVVSMGCWPRFSMWPDR